ncbi:hypothetical protein GGR53DRAFT_497213 [Hypoxylon sp. FL1150]|nr:hypothetical protein GGR53DRAFT_497213 [Hypoxylon sp. FL1150]
MPQPRINRRTSAYLMYLVAIRMLLAQSISTYRMGVYVELDCASIWIYCSRYLRLLTLRCQVCICSTDMPYINLVNHLPPPFPLQRKRFFVFFREDDLFRLASATSSTSYT